MENKLVTVRVISYNAASTIVETLDSIKAQTYQNIELIVSDDCSKDDTVEIARKWIEENKTRFVRTELLTVPQNTGVCANLNRAIKASRGEWIKGIAADDILLPDCISDFVNYVNDNKEALFVAGLQKEYNGTFEEKNYIRTSGHIAPKYSALSSSEQLKKIAFGLSLAAPAVFMNRKLLEDIGGYDERYGYEDHPLYISILERGHKIYYLPKETVGYRIHESTMHASCKLFNPKFLPHIKKFQTERVFQYYDFRQKLSLRLTWSFQDFLESVHLNNETPLMKVIYQKIMAVFFYIGK